MVSKYLHEVDVPSELQVPELNRWLLCRPASTRGKKADLISR